MNEDKKIDILKKEIDSLKSELAELRKEAESAKKQDTTQINNTQNLSKAAVDTAMIEYIKKSRSQLTELRQQVSNLRKEKEFVTGTYGSMQLEIEQGVQVDSKDFIVDLQSEHHEITKIEVERDRIIDDYIDQGDKLRAIQREIKNATEEIESLKDDIKNVDEVIDMTLNALAREKGEKEKIEATKAEAPKAEATKVEAGIPNISSKRIYIDVSYADKLKAKSLGAKWDVDAISWYIPPGMDTAPFANWMNPTRQEMLQNVTSGHNGTYIKVPYNEKDEARQMGAKWDRQQQSWYIPSGMDTAPFITKWPTREATTAQQPEQKVYLAVPYEERNEAKPHGAKWDSTARLWYAGPDADMTALQRWLPGQKQEQPQEQTPVISPREEFAAALRSVGCVVDGEHPIMDGQIHRISVEGDKLGSRSGFYIDPLPNSINDNEPSGYIRNSRTGEEIHWTPKGYLLDGAEKVKLQTEVSAMQTARMEEQQQYWAAYADHVAKKIEELQPVTQQTSYMFAKGIQVHKGVMTDEQNATYIPGMDVNGKQWMFQEMRANYYGTEKDALFLGRDVKEGCFHPVGGLDAVAAAPVLLITTNYATAATLTEATGQAAVAAFTSSNLEAVAKALHERFPDKPVVIASDDDRYMMLTRGVNPGRDHAIKAASSVGGRAVFPIFAPGENSYPENLPPITPETYRAHRHAEQILGIQYEFDTETMTNPHSKKIILTDRERDELEKHVLSNKQTAALERIEMHTNFNDLATNSKLGREGVIRQVTTVINKVKTRQEQKPDQIQEQMQKREQKNTLQQRIGR